MIVCGIVHALYFALSKLLPKLAKSDKLKEQMENIHKKVFQIWIYLILFWVVYTYLANASFLQFWDMSTD
jgi:hypothetical protein